MNASNASQRAVIVVVLAVLVLAGVLLDIPPAQREVSHAPVAVEQTRILQPRTEWDRDSVWEELTRRHDRWAWRRQRSSLQTPQLALNEETELEFVDTPLQDAIEFVADSHCFHVVLDGPALDAAGITPDLPVNLAVSGVPLRDALEMLLRPLNLRYTIQGERLVITTTAAQPIQVR